MASMSRASRTLPMLMTIDGLETVATDAPGSTLPTAAPRVVGGGAGIVALALRVTLNPSSASASRIGFGRDSSAFLTTSLNAVLMDSRLLLMPFLMPLIRLFAIAVA